MQRSHNPAFRFEESPCVKKPNVCRQGCQRRDFLQQFKKQKTELYLIPLKASRPEKIPALYVTRAGRKKYLKDISQSLDVEIDVEMEEKKRWGHNIIGYLDNGAPYTVVIGAHYDHLGFGEDGNSLYRGTEKMIHPGADDNASGTAGMMELARLAEKNEEPKNELFIYCFFRRRIRTDRVKIFYRISNCDRCRKSVIW